MTTTRTRKREPDPPSAPTEIAPFKGTSAAELHRQMSRGGGRPLTIDAFRDRVGKILELEAMSRRDDDASECSYMISYTDPQSGQDYEIAVQEIGRHPGIYTLVRQSAGEPDEAIVRCDTSAMRGSSPYDRGGGAGPLEATLVHGVGQLTGAWDSILARQAVESTHAFEREKALRSENDELRKRVAELEMQRSGFSNPETLEKLVPLAMKGLETFARVKASNEDEIIDRWLGRLSPETRAKVCEELEAWERSELERLAAGPPKTAATNTTNGAETPAPAPPALTH